MHSRREQNREFEPVDKNYDFTELRRSGWETTTLDADIVSSFVPSGYNIHSVNGKYIY